MRARDIIVGNDYAVRIDGEVFRKTIAEIKLPKAVRIEQAEKGRDTFGLRSVERPWKEEIRKEASSSATENGSKFLASLVPDIAVKKRYISRKFGKNWDYEVLDYARQTKRNVIIKGPTGSAKTTMVEAYAARNGIPVVTIPGQRASEPEHYFGSYHPTPEGGFKWVDGAVTLAARYGGIVYLDEVNFVPAGILSVLHPALDYRRLIVLQDKGNEIVNAHKDFQVIASYNPNYRGTLELGEAFSNRYAITMKFDYKRAIEIRLVKVMPSLVEIAGKLRKQYKVGDLDTPIPTNALQEFEDFSIDLGFDFALENFLSRFAPEEENAVKLVFKMYTTKLEEELESFNTKDDTPELEPEVEVDEDEDTSNLLFQYIQDNFGDTT